MALAIIQGGKKGHPHAPLWYKSNPVEPIGRKSSVSVEDSILIEEITLDAILDQILASKAAEVIIVNHGSGDGLALPLLKGSTAGAQKEVMVFVAADVSREEGEPGGIRVKTPIKSDKDVADLTRLSEAQVKALRVKMNQVRARKLKHVAFRACNMGIHKDTLEAFRNFFGAGSVSAPTQFDSYGIFTPAIGDHLDDWVKAKRKGGYQISVDGNVAFGTKATDNPLVYSIVSKSTSDDAFSAWMKKHISDAGWKTTGVIFHGMKLLHPASPTSPTVAFVRDEPFVSSIVDFSG